MLPRAAIPIQEPLRASRRPPAGVLPELPITYIYVYPPRDGAELAIVAQLLNAAIEHMTSTGTDQSGDRSRR